MGAGNQSSFAGHLIEGKCACERNTGYNMDERQKVWKMVEAGWLNAGELLHGSMVQQTDRVAISDRRVSPKMVSQR